MPVVLQRFVPGDWPGDDPEEDGPEFDDLDRRIFAWRRYCNARVEWREQRGLPLLNEVRAQTVGERQIRGEAD